MTDDAKRRAAEQALSLVEDGSVIGVGTGSTVAYFIEGLAGRRVRAVSSSERSSTQLRALGIDVITLEQADNRLGLYIDGADEVDAEARLIKGGGGALTREKILAEVAERFVCIVGANKQVEVLGAFPLPIEVIPMAAGYLSARLTAHTGGRVQRRADFVTDNGNLVLDVHGLRVTDPETLEQELERLPGVVTVGLFARRKADHVLVG